MRLCLQHKYDDCVQKTIIHSERKDYILFHKPFMHLISSFKLNYFTMYQARNLIFIQLCIVASVYGKEN